MKGNILTRIVDRIVYSTTKKPRHYVEVRNPPRTPQQKNFQRSKEKAYIILINMGAFAHAEVRSPILSLLERGGRNDIIRTVTHL